ncbi:hypothetical protein [Clostridium akagii]|uniref:hypothetical protein n=1 Tax=Clostridium akagii TaxID=91623 RepID=UPI00047AA216|nr:hypothetical protein [Clostridium akagii]
MKCNSLLQKINKELTDNVPLVKPEKYLFSRPKNISIGTTNISGNSLNKIIIYLRSDVGGEHGTETGGCACCKHWRLGTAGIKLDIPNMYINQYLYAVKLHGLQPVVSLYNEGNILNTNEVPIDELIYIIKHMSKNNVKKLIIESRPEFIDQNKLTKIKAVSGNMTIEIGIGLESVNDFVRNELFLKNMKKSEYESAVKIINENNMKSLTYVILKPAFLNEVQAIKEAIETIKYVFNAGSHAVSLEPIGVEPYTVTNLLYEDCKYIPPKLWSVLEVLKQTYQLGEIRIGACQVSPRPTTLPSNCDKCTNKVLEKFDEWNCTYDISVLNELYCSNCYDTYIDDVNKLDSFIDEKSIEKDILDFINHYNTVSMEKVTNS